ncbi:family S53 protease [Athelia psychrophila]|uniref:tripeptidyl-peptidase II n=1 Tax=Athelia psychrophila TaxID=1759441 RepID=A0A166SD30_9AGAM|nr:family S53 protease [Fibularhizoctonia sp. CBS 109695]
MIMLLPSLSLASYLVLVCAGSSTDMTVLSSRNAPADGFVYQGAPPVGSDIYLRVALSQADAAGLENALHDVSSPTSANFRKHLSKAEVEKYVQPTNATQSAVTSFLESHGVTHTKLSSAGDWLGFTVPVATANEMFAANFSAFKRSGSSETLIRTLSYSIPTSLTGHIEGVIPTTSFTVHSGGGGALTASSQQQGQASNVSASCNTTITPACIQAMYGLPTDSATQSGNGLAVAGFIGFWPQKTDLAAFLTELRPDLNPNTSFTIDLIDNGTAPQGPGLNASEANLDIQYTVGLASNVPVTFISAGQLNSTDLPSVFLDMAHYLTAMENPPQVLSSSYAFNESLFDAPAARKLCNAYMQLGARGVSVLFGSGDGGVSGVYNQTCEAFHPTFPSSCPFVTSVGGTTGFPETAAALSGGGFSNIFAPAAYQKPYIAAYLKELGSTNAGRYNASGRGFPDVSAQALFVKTINGGNVQLINGTSCSTPIFASTLALINDQLLAAGKSALGFINPLLYANPDALNDIVTGNNPGCGTDGFTAVSGWDPVTGLGTPNFDKLKSIAGL